jgi:hypothetical protein
MHIFADELTGGLYCPPGSMIPDECWPLEPSMPSGGSVTRIPALYEPPGFYLRCPLRGQGHGYVTDPMKNLYRFKTLLVSIPSPDGSCKPVKFEVRLKPR